MPIGILTAIWIACWFATYTPDFNKQEPKETTPVEQSK